MYEVEEYTLDNGLRCAQVGLRHLHSISITIVVRVGSRYETTQTAGLSHFLEHMLFRGTQKHPSSYAFNCAMEKLGGTLSAATYPDFTEYQVAVPPENASPCLTLLGEMLTQPVFAGIEAEKKVIFEEILEDLDEEGRDVDADNFTRTTMFDGNPLGRTIIGTKEGIAGFGEADLHQHLQTFYQGRNMTMAIAGPLAEGQVRDDVAAHFGALVEGSRRTPPPALAPAGPLYGHLHHAASQTEVRLAFKCVGERDERQTSVQMLARVLDDGFCSRLQQHVCDRLGLAYHVFSGVDAYEDIGVFDVGASTEHANVPALIEAVYTVLRELADAPVSAEELAVAKNRYVWDLNMLVDDTSAVASLCASQLAMNLPTDLSLLEQRVRRVDSTELQQIARETFTAAGRTLATVGSLSGPLAHRTEELASLTFTRLNKV